MVQEILKDNNLNDGSVTRIYVEEYTTLTLTVVSSKLARQCEWEVLKYSRMASDLITFLLGLV